MIVKIGKRWIATEFIETMERDIDPKLGYVGWAESLLTMQSGNEFCLSKEEADTLEKAIISSPLERK